MTDTPVGTVAEHATTASRMLFRANVYFEAWWLSAGVVGRREFKDFWEENWEFWRFNEHAMQFAFVVYIAGLFENRSNTINFMTLWKEARSRASKVDQANFETLLKTTQATAKSIMILRSNAMAHRSIALTYADAFKKAKVTPDQIRTLLRSSWRLLNIIEAALGCDASRFETLPIEALRQLASWQIAKRQELSESE